MKYKTRNPHEAPEKPLDFDTLLSSGNEISINQRIDIFMGPDPEGFTYSGLQDGTDDEILEDYKTIKIRTALIVDAYSVNKFKVGDVVSISNLSTGSPAPDPVTLHRNAIKSMTIDGDYTLIEMVNSIPNVGYFSLSQELVIRVSNLNCYRVDEFGFTRFYSATAELSSVETDMGDLFDYEYKTGDYTFQIQNYDGYYDKYLPGGANKISWAGRLVKVYVGMGEEQIKNRLIFEGVTHFDSGVNEENKKLQINAYHISYIYNKEVNIARFKNVEDKDFENKMIPILLGDYTTPMQVGTKNFPCVPAVLVNSTPRAYYPEAKILSAQTKADALVIKAYVNGTTYNGYKFNIKFYDQIKPKTWDYSGAITYNDTTKVYDINCYAGCATDGTLYSSTKYIKERIYACAFVGPLTGADIWQITGEANIAMVDFSSITNYNQDHPNYSNQSGTAGQTRHQIEITTMGGGTVLDVEYKICSNALDSSLTDFSAWFCKGSPDEEKNWASEPYKIGSTVLYSYQWDTQNGRLFLYDIPEITDLTEWKLFVSVKSSVGSVYEPTFYPQVNIANTNRLLMQNRTPLSTGTRNDPFAIPNSYYYIPRSPFIMGEAYWTKHFQYYFDEAPKNKRFGGMYGDVLIPYSKAELLGAGYSYFPPTGTWRRWYTGYSTPYTTFQNTTFRDSADFVAEVELVTNLGIDSGTTYGTTGHIQCIFSLKDGTSEAMALVLRNNYLCLYFNNRTKFVLASNKQLTAGVEYQVRVKKSAGTIRLYVKNLYTAGPWEEVSYNTQNTWTSGDNKSAYKCEIGYSQNNANINYPVDWNWFKGLLGTIRIANEHDAFETDYWIDLITPPTADDPASIARQILEYGGTPASRFDSTISEVARLNLPTNLQYKARIYMDEEGKKAVELAQEFLAQFGMVLTMNAVDNLMKFNIICDSPEMYRYDTRMYQLTDFDIERDSISTDREVNKYFNSAFAKYDYVPALGELNRTSLPFYEPAALERDAGVQHWYKLEEKDRLFFELPGLYQTEDIENRLKDALAISTPDTEMITLNVSYRYLLLTVGSFVFLTVDRYKNVPCMVRAVTIDPNSSSVKLKLMSLENVRYTDKITGLTYTPSPDDEIGGLPAKDTITNYSNNEDL